MGNLRTAKGEGEAEQVGECPEHLKGAEVDPKLGLDLSCLDNLPLSSCLTRVSCLKVLGAICWGTLQGSAENSPTGMGIAHKYQFSLGKCCDKNTGEGSLLGISEGFPSILPELGGVRGC